MKKLLVSILLIGAIVGAWKWSTHEPAQPSSTKDLVLNRIWADHMPKGEKDTVKLFALWQPESFGVFADRNWWRVELERFRYEAHGGKVEAVWPLSGKRVTLTVKAERCRVEDWDFCLEITGAPSGIQRYYSRLGWERKDRRSVNEMITELMPDRAE
jgi:hypothetical protein